ncbi:unnamed protein product [Cladocopium goreaui]|uniref:Eukaryotic translation initiation factor 3 subunit A n=1 Tax=Cladocopium goreaui TaxID=2562237 RepID=A0A9P1FR65_9DINO|nr:unnamed protein product [Cladocopium goreaui]
MPPWRVSIDRCFGPEEHLLSPPLRCPVHDNSPLSPPSEASDEICDERQQLQRAVEQPELHAAVWLGDVETVQAILERRADVNAEDVHGVSPLMLAVELMPRSQEYSQMVSCLLSQGAQPRRRSSAGWSPLDEAVSRRDVQLVRTLFDAAQKDLRKRWDVRLSSIAKSLQLLPDFECRIRWEFESPVIPWLSKIAPSDVILVRKRGSCLRLDSTLASWKRFRFSKRRNLTTLFLGERFREDGPGAPGGPGGGDQMSRGLFMVNHDKEVIVDMTQSLDGEEAAAVVEDLVKADAMQWDMNICSLEVSESTSWLGSVLGPCDVNGWTCMRYEVKGELGMTLRKKGWRIQDVTFQDYFGRPLPADACLPELRREFEAAKQQPESLKVSHASTTDHGFGFGDDLDSDAGSVHSEVLDHWPEENGPLPVVEKPMAVAVTTVTPQPSRPLEPRDRQLGGMRTPLDPEGIIGDFGHFPNHKLRILSLYQS